MTPSGPQPAYTVGRVGADHANSLHTTGEVHLSYVGKRPEAEVVFREHSQSPDRPNFQVCEGLAHHSHTNLTTIT